MRLCIFAHYDPHGELDPHVQHHLKALKAVADRLVLVSTAKLNPLALQKAGELCDQVLPRENAGFDFYSYRTGLFNTENWQNFDEILFCNDSIYGPLFDLNLVFSKMQNAKCDFWALTDNLQFKPHLQSFFLVFRKNCIKSTAFKKFWDQVSILPSKTAVIQNYELEVQAYFENAGFSSGVYYQNSFGDQLKALPIAIRKTLGILKANPKEVLHLLRHLQESSRLNKTHYFAAELLEQKVPYLKVELFRDNPEKQDLNRLRAKIKAVSNYPLNLIESHTTRTKHDR